MPSPATVGPLLSNILKRKFNMHLLSKVLSFQGRDTRLDYLASIGMSVAFLLVGFLILIGLGKAFAPATLEPGGEPPLLAVIALVLLFAAVAAMRVLSTCRRFRDMGRSPWLTLLMIVPGVNPITGLALLFIPSAQGQSPHEAANVF